MTKKQEQILNRLKKDILDHDSMRFPDYEYKKWEVKEQVLKSYLPHRPPKIYVYLRCVVGKVGDEGTWAAMLCRDHRLMVIGPKGGVRGLLGVKKHGYSQALIWSKEH